MRQAGILAAAGLLALKDGDEGMITRLADDHANARRLGEALSAMDGIRSPGHLAQPDDWRARSRPHPRRTSCCSAWNAIASSSLPNSSRAAC